jgi:hypothetical protein
MKKLLTILVLVLVIAGIWIFLTMHPSSTATSSPTAAASTVPFTTLAAGAQSDVTSRVDYLITSQDQLTQLWNLLQQPPPVPTVDFTTQDVVAVFAGQAPTTGYSIAVAQVEDANSRIVKIELTKPDDSCVLAQSTTAPYQIIELPKTSLPFTHDDTLTTKACP